MHVFVNGKELNSALGEFEKAGIKEAVIRATSSRSIELSGFSQPKERWGTAVQLWVNVPLSRETGAAECEPVMVRLKELRGITNGDVEIEADCFGFFANHALHDKALVDLPSAFAGGMPGLDWGNSLAVNVKHEDCRAIAWALRAMGGNEELCKRGFDRLCIRDGVAEATDGHRAHRANVSFGSPEVLVHSVMADLMSRQPGALKFRSEDEQEFAEYRAGSIRMATVRLRVGAWPDFERVMPYNAPSATLHAAHVLETVESAVNGFRAAVVRLSARKGKRDLIVEGLESVAPMHPPYDKLVKIGEMRLKTATIEDPWPSDDFSTGSKYNAAYVTDALAGYDGYAKIYYAGDDAPLLIADETGRAALVMPLS